MNDHDHYEELAALSAGGLLSEQEVLEVDSVFVTVAPAGGAPTPSGQTMLYAYLG